MVVSRVIRLGVLAGFFVIAVIGCSAETRVVATPELTTPTVEANQPARPAPVETATPISYPAVAARPRPQLTPPLSGASLLFEEAVADGSIQGIALSPDGTRIAYLLSTKQPGNTISTLRVRTIPTGTIIADHPGVRYDVLKWSPNGRYLAYGAAALAETPRSIGILDARGAPLRAFSDQLFPRPPGSFAWSPDSTTLVVATTPDYPSNDAVSLLFVEVADSRIERAIDLAGWRFGLATLEWSNDESFVWYSSSEGGGCGARVLTLSPVRETWPGLAHCPIIASFDGSRVVTEGSVPDPARPTDPLFGIYLDTPQATEPRQIVTAEQLAPKSSGDPWATARPLWWLNDHDVLVATIRERVAPANPGFREFPAQRQKTTFYRLNASTGSVHTILTATRPIAFPVVLPTGAWGVITTSEGDRAQPRVGFWRVAVTDTALRRVNGTDSCLRVRPSPTLASPILTCLEDGRIVLSLGETREQDGVRWLKIRTPDRREGWASGEFLQ